jgi:DNA repair exonuclease SbcCD ATPase subunit
MVDVNICQIGNIVSELSSVIDEYEEAQINIFNQLKDSCNNWHDFNSLTFGEKAKEEKKTSADFLSALENSRKTFKYVYDEYKSIGDKLHFNMEQKDAIIDAIDQCISLANSAIDELNSINRSFYYHEIGMINSQRDQISSVRKELKSMKEKVNSLHKKVTNIEEKVASRIAKLEEVKVNLFDFKFNRS